MKTVLYPVVRLKSRRDVPVRAGHPWVFSEGIAEAPDVEPGALVRVVSDRDEELGIGMFNARTSIRVRLLTRRSDLQIDAAFFAARLRELDSWKMSRLPEKTTGYRVAHAEADGLPGLIVDRYADVVVFQIHTAGMDRLRSEIIAGLEAAFQPRAIVERSDVDARRLEGLREMPIGVMAGSLPEVVSFQEYGMNFIADVLDGQKTGFFLDQREARHALAAYAKDKVVWNLFGYTGAFSVAAATGGARHVATVDVSHAALEGAERNLRANGFDPENEERFSFLEADVLDLLAAETVPLPEPDIIICDPPAFVKRAEHLEQGLKAYTRVNQACLRLLRKGGILCTSSCSGRVGPEEFRGMIRLAAGRAGRDLRLLDWISQPVDHAERLAFPEGRYLKTAICEVRDTFE